MQMQRFAREKKYTGLGFLNGQTRESRCKGCGWMERVTAIVGERRAGSRLCCCWQVGTEARRWATRMSAGGDWKRELKCVTHELCFMLRCNLKGISF